MEEQVEPIPQRDVFGRYAGNITESVLTDDRVREDIRAERGI